MAWKRSHSLVAALLVPLLFQTFVVVQEQGRSLTHSQPFEDGSTRQRRHRCPLISNTQYTADWNITDVVVSFVCAGDGVVTCPDPVTIEQDGVRDVSGTASNDLWAEATTSISVRLDWTAPSVSTTSPIISTLVSPGPGSADRFRPVKGLSLSLNEAIP